MADGGASFVIDLDASSAGMSAEQAADKLEALNAEMAKARDLAKAWQAAGKSGKEGLAAQRRQIESLKASIQSHNLAMAKEGVTLREVRNRRKEQAESQKKAKDAAMAEAKERGAAMQRYQADLRKEQEAIGKGRAASMKLTKESRAALLAEAAAAYAFAASIGVAVAALGAFIVKSADARRSELLRLEGMTKMRSWWGVAAGNAGELQAAIDRVSASSAISRDQVASYTTQLYKAGLRGDNLVQTLDAMAIKASAQGEEAAQAFAGWATGAALAGHSVKGLADRVRGQLGGIVQKQMLSLDVQWMKFKENIMGIGKAFNIEPVLRGLNTVLSMFREGSAVGDAWRSILQAIFGPIFEDGEQGGLAIKRVIQGATIAILNMGTAGLKASAAIGRMMPDWVKRDWVDWNDALKVTEYVLYGVGGALAVVATGFAMTAAPLIIMGGALVAAWTAAKNLANTLTEAWDSLSRFGWGNLGTMMVNGLVEGIKSAASGAVDAIGGLAASMRDKFKDVMGIHSPSQVFADFGRNIGKGTAQGVGDESPRAQRAVEDMVHPPQGAFSATTNNSSRSVTIHNLNVTAGAQGIGASVRDELYRALEGVALEMGGARV